MSKGNTPNQKSDLPDLGYFGLCFDVKDIKKSVEFYETLGFEIFWGDVEAGHCALYNGDVRLVLFEDGTIQREFGVKFLFNFRGGDVDANYEKLTDKGIKFEMKPETFVDGVSRHSKLRDPDGNLIYLDTSPEDKEIINKMD